jgi:hypothetical protein
MVCEISLFPPSFFVPPTTIPNPWFAPHPASPKVPNYPPTFTIYWVYWSVSQFEGIPKLTSGLFGTRQKTGNHRHPIALLVEFGELEQELLLLSSHARVKVFATKRASPCLLPTRRVPIFPLKLMNALGIIHGLDRRPIGPNILVCEHLLVEWHPDRE